AAASGVDAGARSTGQVAAATCVYEVRIAVPKIRALGLELEMLDPELRRAGCSFRADLRLVQQAERTAEGKLPSQARPKLLVRASMIATAGRCMASLDGSARQTSNARQNSCHDRAPAARPRSRSIPCPS